MPALIPVHNTLGALLIGTVLSSIIYGVTWLQVYSYYNSHCSRDRWPLKSLVSFLMLVDSTNVVFVIYTTYHIGVTNFGDYPSLQFVPWSLPAIALSGFVLEATVQHFYAYRIYLCAFNGVLHLCGTYFCLVSRGSPYLPAAISTISLTAFGIGIVFGTKALKHIHEPGNHFRDFCIAASSCNVFCDALITFGMVYTLLSNRTQVRRTNNVLNHLAIYSINCGTLTLVFAISCVILLAKYPNALLYTPPFFILNRLYFCAFMSVLNSRDHLRETLDGHEGVITFSQLKERTGTTLPCAVQVTMETSTTAAISLPPVSVSFDTSISDCVIAFNREKYPVSLAVPQAPGVLTA
ncbi:hypothetical protein EDB92DRAFT_63708 [Lactarius akahatsu]|uniref:DUF6534 domain-containing protein n=1 Tax=Lactarius akahatsu TaxID=416441 RepID=A0AAD4LT86_9AGAM|nr:hypothetical protein EDB92DRAFT_63708 [Lactarius akahatsu]